VTEQVIAITSCVSCALMPQKCVSGQGGTPLGELTALPQSS